MIYNINMCEVGNTDKDLNMIFTMAFVCGVGFAFSYWLYETREERPEDEKGLFVVFAMASALLLFLLIVDYMLYVFGNQ